MSEEAAWPIDDEALDLEKWAELFDFSGKTAVVTGGTGVIGGEIACGLAGLGARVAILGRNAEAGEKVQQRLGSERDRIDMITADVRDEQALRAAAKTIEDRFKRVDFLVNAAGGNDSRATTGAEHSFFDLASEALRSVVDLNLMGTVLPSQVFGRQMAEQKQGAIVNVTSMAAARPLTKVGAYGASKAAVTNFTQWLAVHLAQECSPHIRVNAIAPGFLLTVQNRFLVTDRISGELTARGKSIVAHTPMGRFGKPQDLLGAVFWLLSPAASFVTGAVIPVDGGFGAYSGV